MAHTQIYDLVITPDEQWGYPTQTVYHTRDGDVPTKQEQRPFQREWKWW